MYVVNTDPAVQAATFACLRASITWARAAQRMGMFLPAPDPESTLEEQAWHLAVKARTGLSDRMTVEQASEHTHHGYMVFYTLNIELLAATSYGCPNHLPIQDLCHGAFGKMYAVLNQHCGLDCSRFLEFMCELHRDQSRDCLGFSATTEALAGCTTDGRPDRIYPWT